MFRPLTGEMVSLWPSADYVHGTTRGPELFIVTGFCFGIATISIIARLYSRIFIRRFFGPDDALICFAYIASIGVTGCSLIAHIRYGWDRHIWDLLPTKIESSLKTLYVIRIFWGFTTSAIRLSICCLYYRLLDRINAPRSFRIVLHCFTAFTIGLAIVYPFVTILPCRPIRAYWSLANIPGQVCDEDGRVMEIVAVFNTLSELVIAILPILAAFNLRIDERQRWAVISLLSLGLLVAFAGCFRTYYLWRSMSVPDFDMTWWAEPHSICLQVEMYIAIVSACAAPLRPFVGYVYRTFRNRYPRSSRSSIYTGGAGKRPSFSTFTSATKSKSFDISSRAMDSTTSTSPPRYFDLEGINADDGYGYTVTITGPSAPPKRRRSSVFRRGRKQSITSNGNDSTKPVLALPEAMYRSNSISMHRESSKHRSNSMGKSFGGTNSGGLPEGMAFDIETTREVEVKEEYQPYQSRSSADWERRNWEWQKKAAFPLPEMSDFGMKDRNGSSWYKE